MSDRDFEINGLKFKLNNMDAFKQFHIAKKIAPILSELIPSIGSIKQVAQSQGEMGESEKLDEIAKIASPLLSGFSKLSDADADKVLLGLLSSVEMQQTAGNWAKISTESMLMIQDLPLPVMLQAAGRAFAFNIAGFFGALPRIS